MPTSSDNTTALQRAARLSHEGKHADAARQLTKLAALADKSGVKRRAANLNALAAASCVEAGDEAGARLHAGRAMDLFVTLDLVFRGPAFYNALLKRIEAKKQTRLLDALRGAYSARVVILSNEARKESLPTGALPATCPGCGIAMRNDTVDWINRARAECDFCGTVVDAG